MARSYAQFMTAIWRKRKENDFVKLSGNAQRMYMLLSSQSEISAAGTLRLTVDHWATLASDTTPEQVRAALLELANGSFLVVDHETGELLVRSFVRWDGGYSNSKRRPVILEAGANVDSLMLRIALAVEFERLGLPTDGLGVPAAQGSDGANSPELDSIQESLFSQVDSLCQDQPQNTQNDRVVVTYVGNSPQPSTLNPQTVPAARAAAPPTTNQRAQELARVYTDVVKLSNFLAVLGVVKKAITSGEYADDQIRAALARLATDRRTVSTETLRIELEGPPSRAVLRAVSGGYQPFQSPVDQSVYDEGI